MDLRELSSALPKPWLNINAHTLNADSVTAAAFTSDSLVVLEQAGVANPAPGKLAIFADLAGELKTTDALGSTNIVLSQAVAGVPTNIPIYDASGTKLEDSAHHLSEYATLSGATFTGAVVAPQLTSSGVPVSSWRACKGATWSAVGPGTILEASMIDLPYNGSLVIAQPITRGFSLRMSFMGVFSSGAATVTTLRFKVNGTTVLTTTLPAAAALTNEAMRHDYWLQIQEGGAARIMIGSTTQRNGVLPILADTLVDGVWDAGASNTLSATIQFSDVDGTLVTTHWDMWSGYPELF